MGKRTILHIDPDGFKVKRYEKNGLPLVAYERYPGVDYIYTTEQEAWDICIAGGSNLTNRYIPSLTDIGLAEAMAKTSDASRAGRAQSNDEGEFVLPTGLHLDTCLIGELYFENVTLSSGLEEELFCVVSFDDKATARRTVFLGDVSLIKTRFNGVVDLSSAVFCGRFLCNRSKMRKRCFFRQAIFGDLFSCQDTRFDNIVAFDRSLFLVDADFRNTRFMGRCTFTGCVSPDFSFHGTRFGSLFDIKDVFTRSLDFERATFRENALILGSRWRDVVDKHVRDVGSVSFFKKARQSLLQSAGDLATPLQSIDFRDALIQGELRFDFSYIDPDVAGAPVLKPHQLAVASGKSYDWEGAHKQYSWLKEQYRKQGFYEDEDKTLYRAMSCKRKASRGMEAVVYFLYQHILGFGVHIRNVLLSVVATLCLFAGIYFALYDFLITANAPFTGAELSARLANSIYFSVITFATVGYGDISPSGWLVPAAMMEGMLGAMLNASLIVVLFRKIVR